jgi:hypothetical protein
MISKSSTPFGQPSRHEPLLRAQAGEAHLREVVTAGGLTQFRRAAETPLSILFS